MFIPPLSPNLETDPTYQQFIVNQRPNQVTVKVNYDSNPFFTDELKAELEYQKEIDDFTKSKRYSDYNKFFLDQEKIIKSGADKTIRKISKLYDLAESEELDFEESENCIIDMETYHRLNGIKINIKKYKEF